MIKVSRFHRSRLLTADTYKTASGPKVGFEDLYQTFLRNRVWLEFKNVNDASEDEQDRLTALIEAQIVNSLENKCTGFWTVDYEENKEEDSFGIFIMFENEPDLQEFLKTEAMIFRLTA